jgi:hypothetical protein
MALSPVEYGHIVPWDAQFLDENGKPLTGGHIEIFVAGTSTRYISYQNFDGNVNPFKIPLNAGGQCVAIGSLANRYDIYVYNRFGNEVYSRLNVGVSDSSGTNLTFSSSDGSIIITRTGNNVDLVVNTENTSYGTLTASELDFENLIKFEEKTGTVAIADGKIGVEAGKLYHLTLVLETASDPLGTRYATCTVTDSENGTHDFVIDESIPSNLSELSWDMVPTSNLIGLELTLPEHSTMTAAKCYIHKVSMTNGGSGGGGGSNVTVVSTDESVTVTPTQIGSTTQYDLSIPEAEIPVRDVTVDGTSVVNAQGVAEIDLSDYVKEEDLPSIPVSDVEVNGSSVVNAQGVAEVTVPTKTSDLDNDSGFITASDVPAQIQANWNEEDSSDPSYIQNKPALPVIGFVEL